VPDPVIARIPIMVTGGGPRVAGRFRLQRMALAAS
jgi:hypothetical protein